jgi:hypothetical protein
MVASAIMAMAFLPIAGLIRDSFHKVGDQRMEGAVATYAAEVMNEWMFEKPYRDVTVNLDGDASGPWSYTIPDKELEDGLVVQVVVNVYEVDPDLDAGITGNEMTFEFCRIDYHSPSGCAGGEENTLTADPVTVADNLRNINSDADEIPYPARVDSKYGPLGTDLPPMVTIHMAFRWKARWETWPLPGSDEETSWERTRMRHLICRRANLE